MTQRVSDVNLESVVPSEGSTVSVEKLVIRPAASARGFVIGLAQLDAFTLTTIFERRTHVMRVVPHVMRAAFGSAIRVACEETVRRVQCWRHHSPRVGLEAFAPPPQDAPVQAPQRRPCSEEGTGAEVGVFQRRELARVGLVQHSHR